MMTGIKTTSSRKILNEEADIEEKQVDYRHQPSVAYTSYHSELCHGVPINRRRRRLRGQDDRSGKKFVVAMQTRQDDDGGTVSLNLRSEFVRSIKQANQANP